MDLYLFEKINGLVYASKALDYIGMFFADYFQYIIGAIIIILLLWKKNRIMILSAAISVFLSRLVIAEIVKIIIQRARPYVVLETANKIIFENADFKSMPSGHAAIFFALAMAIYFYNKKLGVFFFVSAILISLARIFCGVHWPSDILVGVIIGIVSGIIVDLIIRKKKTYGRN
ncbi:MAG TPA: phosphatase PAP2 family protein [Candidatus Paceibacterota bacterium]|nr:phosphatase PAP2 family protein [Candidatus Paceibacterota bacterium]